MTDAQPNIHRRRLGLALKSLRTKTGMTLKEAAVQLVLSGESALSRIEHGRQRVPPTAVLGYCEVYEVREKEQREYLLYLAKLASSSSKRGKNLFEEYRIAVKGRFGDYLQLEEMATKSETFAHFVPGLLQTEEYARAIVQGSREWQTDREIDSFVRLRLERAKALTRENPLHLWVVLDEAGLFRQVGSPEIMRAQLDHLTRVASEYPHVTIQILPFAKGAHSGLEGAFQLLHFAAGPPVVVVEPLTTTLFLEEDRDIGRYETTMNHLRTEALDAAASLQLIRDAKKEHH
ncbi:helix-turn-helix transcriptional regulator [Streptomyces sp. DSM 44915]|uniref:Helix-turn-helix transcriptional regulator n=1 Tax=Streptomyces chisholmiae TaxID=3075540 RepID=A0ABU2JVR1_9ACTN|nr:helix-turn-helix transcriptional regulator [Streptomyces sp. DSM 44915]MDT0269054.1 helix-turn-helix transcriptional regulator [Streptomyces sp. DSM 44915]